MTSGGKGQASGWSLRRMVVAAVVIQVLLTFVSASFRLRRDLDDTDLYSRYASFVLAGKVPYRDFRVEYPPLAVPLFVLPAMIGSSRNAYRLAFAVEMLLFNAATVWAVGAWVRRREGLARVPYRLARYTFLYLLLARLIVTRYDAAAMFVGFAAAAWWFSGRPRLGGTAAAIGALLKIYPGAVAMVAIAQDIGGAGRGRGRGSVAFGATLTVGALSWLAVGGAGGVSASLGYHLDRGFEMSSVYSGLQMLVANALGAEIAVVRDHAAWSSVTPWSRRLLPIVFPIQASALLLVSLTFVRRGRADPMRYAGAAVLAFMVTGKVFSPQYLIWMVPFVAVVEGPGSRRAAWLFAAGCGLALAAPAVAGWFPRTGTVAVLAYNFKNALFLWLFGLLTFGPRGGSAEAQATRYSGETTNSPPTERNTRVFPMSEPKP